MKIYNKKNIFIFVLILFSIINSNYVFAQEKTKIKVGYCSNKNFIYKDKNNNYTGYAVDCLNKIANMKILNMNLLKPLGTKAWKCLKIKR